MKCLETEKLIGYAYRLIDESAAFEVRAHLGECARCREIVEQHGRLDAVLNGWKRAEPTPGFDARVRQAVEAEQARRAGRGFWGWQWARGLALASLGLLIIAGVVWFTREPSSGFQLSGGSHATATAGELARRRRRQLAKLNSPAVTTQPGVGSAQAVPETESARSCPERRQRRPGVGRL